jgi:hypothetical protein
LHIIYQPSVFQIRANAAISSMNMMVRRPMRLMRIKRDPSFEEPELARVMLLERVQLARRDLVALDRVFLCEEGAHVFQKGSRYGRR